MIGPECESEISAGFSPRELSWNTCEQSIESGSIVAGEFQPARWDAARDERAVDIDEIARTELAAAPWWLWWNVLSLDAPMVAVTWALVFAKAAGVTLPAAEVAALGLVVWLTYTVDRLLDGRLGLARVSRESFASNNDEGAFGRALRQRHFFHRIHARAIWCSAAGVAGFTAIIVLTQIGEQVVRPAVPLGLILILYMAWVHLGRGRVLTQLPKEVAVGGVFAAGVALPAWSRLGTRRWEFFLLAALFAAVCTLNCVAIEEWERVREMDAGGERMAKTNFGSGKFAVTLAACAALLVPIVRLRGESVIGVGIAVSALLILFLDLMRERVSAEGLRVLVDVALLLPALVILAFR